MSATQKNKPSRTSTLNGLLLSLLLPWAAHASHLRTLAEYQRWTPDRAWAWYSAQPWLMGFNYIPATAVNTTEMWQGDTFDAMTIDAELALAEQTGFNCARVFVQYLVWEGDPKGLKHRMAEFLEIAQKHGIRTMFVLFDDCNFSPYPEPFLGKQPEPRGVSNGHWTPSPGPKRAHDRAAWPKLEQYVKDVVGAFGMDKRVLAWETWNEPLEDRVPIDLVEASFRWVRRAKPVQPVAATVYGSAKMEELVGKLSDFVSFHNYSPATNLEAEIKRHLAAGRPVLCTEWMFRPYDSVPETCLPVFARSRVAAFNWGLVNGRTQTHLHMRSTGKPADVWQHDLFQKDHTPYDEKELALFRKAIQQMAAGENLATGQWPAAKAWAWYSARPWFVGCNFLPSTAVNDVEMWQKESFDAKTTDRELGWAQQLGFNSVRVFVNYAVWEADPSGLKETFRRFLKLADKHDISTLVVLFDDCFKPEPSVGKQPDPEPGVHNSQWVQSPGVKRRADQAAWPRLEGYIKDMVTTFGADKRVLAWELYNEPSQSLALVEAAFRWARKANPSQPVTTTIFGNAEMQKRIIELSDVLCFHEYGPLQSVKGQLGNWFAYSRPVLCTEYMARGPGSRFETHLPFFREKKIACWNWGFVAGRTQTYYPWDSPKGAPEPAVWHHDILRVDGTPFSAREIQCIRAVTGRLPASAMPVMPQREIVVPTAEKAPVVWRYTLAKPADDWFKAAFDDGTWKQGAAPFGTEELPIARKPNTIWTNADIWLRREFEMPGRQFTELKLLLHHDEDTEVYINGLLASKAGGFNAAYESFDITPEATATLKPGRNHLAVHTRQTGGGQYIDLGIDGVVSKKAAAGVGVRSCSYRGWKTLALHNGLVELQVLPEVGGRIVQYRLGEKEFLWVNPQLTGKVPTPDGLSPDGSWFNVGGDKLWPAPQGWDNAQQWPGPPDPVLDGQPYALEKLHAKKGEIAVRLTSGKDLRSGIQFSRIVRLFEGSTRVGFEATMKNVDTKSRRWGIWAHTQLNAAKPDGTTFNSLMQAWCPLNPRSHFPGGYEVILGQKDNPSFQSIPQDGLVRVQYQYRVGKIGLDSPAGWVATVDGESGAAFVQRFVFEEKKDYPDGSSVEFWHNGVGTIHAYNKDLVMSTNPTENPYVFESEILSPYAELKPGQSYTWRYDWYACHIGGDFPVLRCSDVGVVAEPLTAKIEGDSIHLRGRFGVFVPGRLCAEIRDVDGKTIRMVDFEEPALPNAAVVVDKNVLKSSEAKSVKLFLADQNEKRVGELAEADLSMEPRQ